MRRGIDVVVVNYRTPKDLAHFLASFAEFPPSVPYTLKIVNVAGTEDDLLVSKEWLPEIEHSASMATETNIGYGRAANFAALYGNFDTVAVFNADIVLRPFALDECYESLHEDPLIGVLGPRQLDSNGVIRHAGVVGVNSDLQQRGFGQRAEAWAPDTPYDDVRDDFPMVLGSALFVPRVTWEGLRCCHTYGQWWSDRYGLPLGPLLETPLYYEDTWLCLHARAHGYKIRYLGTTTITHEWHRSINLNAPVAQHTLFNESRDIFRSCCDAHGIEHE